MNFFSVFDPSAVEALNGLNTTSYRQVVATRVMVLVLGALMAAFFYELLNDHESMAEKIMDAVLLFIAVALGLNTVQYGAKRFSDSGYAAAKASGAPAQVVQTTGTVVAQNPGGPVDAAATTVAAAAPVTVGAPVPAIPIAPIVASRAGTRGIGSAMSPGDDPGDENDWPPARRHTQPVSEPDLYRDDERGT